MVVACLTKHTPMNHPGNRDGFFPADTFVHVRIEVARAGIKNLKGKKLFKDKIAAKFQFCV